MSTTSTLIGVFSTLGYAYIYTLMCQIK